MYNNLRARLVCLQSQAALPPFLPSFIFSETFYWGEGSDGFQLFCQKVTCSVLVQIEQKQTEDMESMIPAGLMWRIWVNLWEMIWSLQPSSSNNQSPKPWSLVTRRDELLQITGSTLFFLSTLKIIPKSARGEGLYNPYLIVIMYISMDTLIKKTMSKSMLRTLKVYTWEIPSSLGSCPTLN